MGIKSDLVEKRNELDAKQKKLASIFAEGKSNDGLDLDKVTSLGSDVTSKSAKLDAIRKLNEEVDALGKEVEALADLERAEKSVSENHEVKGGKDAPRFTDPEDAGPKGIGDLFVESEAYKAWKPGTKGTYQAVIKGGVPALKTTFSTSAGWAPESLRIGRLAEYPLRPIEVIDTVPGGVTTQAAIVYMLESTVTDSSAARNEAAAYAESALALTETTSTVRSIGTSLPVTDEQLADVAQVRSYLNMRLPFLVKRKLDSYILTGTGVAPQLTGFNNLSGIQTQAKGGDTAPDAIYKGMDKIATVGFAMPSVVYIHPTNWQAIRLAKTTDGLYIWGNPSEAGPMRIWGVNVVSTTAQTLGTALVADAASHSQLFMRQDLTVEIGYDSDDFTKGIQTVRCGLRAALVSYRDTAFCTVTGL